MTASPTTTDTFTAQWEAWHARHEDNRAAPHGFLAITGLYWISETPLTLPDAPGEWVLNDGVPAVTLTDGEELRISGTTITGHHVIGEIEERGGISAQFTGGVLEIAKRGGSYILRPRRPDHAFLARYQGTPAYPADPAWVKGARYTAFDHPRPVEVGATVKSIAHVYEAPGFVEFDHDGTTHRLTVFPAHSDDELLVLFTDVTSGTTTYAANRALVFAAPGPDGGVALDFNRATNLPCAYTDFATCPLPPAENRLPIAVEAGEKVPVARVEGVFVDEGIVAAS